MSIMVDDFLKGGTIAGVDRGYDDDLHEAIGVSLIFNK